MRSYSLYCNGQFTVAKPLFTPPTTPADFGVAALSTSVYDIFEIDDLVEVEMEEGAVHIPATLDVGAVGSNDLDLE